MRQFYTANDIKQLERPQLDVVKQAAYRIGATGTLVIAIAKNPTPLILYGAGIAGAAYLFSEAFHYFDNKVEFRTRASSRHQRR
ncbi:MAG: hypothetical protein ACMXYF_05700 [Candidatus Woesearchaeota archaeon]